MPAKSVHPYLYVLLMYVHVRRLVIPGSEFKSGHRSGVCCQMFGYLLFCMYVCVFILTSNNDVILYRGHKRL